MGVRVWRGEDLDGEPSLYLDTPARQARISPRNRARSRNRARVAWRVTPTVTCPLPQMFRNRRRSRRFSSWRRLEMTTHPLETTTHRDRLPR